MRAFLAALGTFTVLPAPHTRIDRGVAGGMMAAMPWVGMVLGALAGGVVHLATLAGAPLLAAVLGVATLAALTGALHIDGLADTADALGSRKPADEALEIMRRSDIGPMGLVSLVLVLMADVAALHALAGSSAATAALTLLVAAAAGRLAVLHASRGPGARGSGFGALFTGTASRPAVVVDTLAVLVLAGVAGHLAAGWYWAGVLVGTVVLALLLAWAWRRHLQRRLGGMTGDTFGSLVEVTQALVLVFSALAAAIPA